MPSGSVPEVSKPSTQGNLQESSRPSQSHTTAQGNEGASGGDQLSDKPKGPWFQDSKRKIKYCMRIDRSNFGVSSDSDLNEHIRKTFYIWIDYFSQKRQTHILGNSAIELLPNGDFAECIGDEDLIFYFGETNERIRSVLNSPPHRDAFALAIPSYANEKAGNGIIWRKGSILWFSNPRSYEKKYHRDNLRWNLSEYTKDPLAPLDVALLHEWGHVFGFDHVPGTILDEDILNRVLSAIQQYERMVRTTNGQKTVEIQFSFLRRIDDSHELLICEECREERIPGYLTYSRGGIHFNDIMNALTGIEELLTGEPEDNAKYPSVTLIIRRKNKYSKLPDSELETFFLLLVQTGERLFEIPLDLKPFSVLRHDAIYTGIMKNALGKVLPISLERNRDKRSPIVIKARAEGERTGGFSIFYAETLTRKLSHLPDNELR